MLKFLHLTLWLALLQAGLLASRSSAGRAPPPESAASLESVCQNKRLALRSISQVKELIGELKREPPSACETYQNSFLELEPILRIVEGGKTCNLELANMLRDYHLRHINGGERKSSEDRIASPLRYFFISLCFQISAECKMTLINSLEYDTKGRITEEDYKTTDMFESYGVTLLDRNTKIADFDDIILLSDINAAVGIEARAKDTKFMVKIKTNMILKDLVWRCTNKFKPFYEKLILPLVLLSNLGYNYQGELLARELNELKDSKLIRRWYNIVQICETLDSMEIFEEQEESVLEDQQAITLIGKEEAESLRGLQVRQERSPEAIVYEPAPAHSGDQLWIQDQEELEKLVSKYRASASESDRIRQKLMQKLLDKFKQSLRTGKVGIFVSDLYKGLAKDKSDRKTNINEDMVSMMDQVVAASEPASGVSALDEPVAGSKRREAPPRRSMGGVNYVPPKVVRMQKPEDQSSLSTKLFERTIGKFLPSKSDIFMWFVGIIGALMIITAVVAG